MAPTEKTRNKKGTHVSLSQQDGKKKDRKKGGLPAKVGLGDTGGDGAEEQDEEYR